MAGSASRVIQCWLKIGHDVHGRSVRTWKRFPAGLTPNTQTEEQQSSSAPPNDHEGGNATCSVTVRCQLHLQASRRDP
jgi:hypothetical protein